VFDYSPYPYHAIEQQVVYANPQPLYPTPAITSPVALPIPATGTVLPDISGPLARADVIRGSDALQIGDIQAARKHFVQGIFADADDASARMGYAFAQFAAGEYGAAARGLRRAFELNPDLLGGGIDVVGTFGGLEFLRDHVRRLEADIDRSPTPSALVVLAYVQLLGDNLGKAYGAAMRAAELSPDNVMIELVLDSIEIRKDQPAATIHEAPFLEPE
jgi:tetratricopeptide (TPR) repeat protein